MSGDVALLTKNNDETALLQLLDCAIKREKEERDQFINHWEKLKRDGRKRIIASDFVVKDADMTNHSELAVTCSSPEDLTMWKHCFAAAVWKLSIGTSTFKTTYNTVSVSLRSIHVLHFLKFLNPLAQRTHFKKGKFADATGVAPCRTKVKLQAVIDSVIAQQRIAMTQLLCHSLVLGSDKNLNVQIFGFRKAVSKKDSRMIIVCETSEDLAVWKACLVSAFLKINVPFATEKRNATTEYFTLKKDDVKSVLEYMKPLFHRTIFETIEFYDTHPEIIQSCSKLLDGKTVSSVEICQDNANIENFKLLLNFLRVVRPSIVEYALPAITEEVLNFLFLLADMVEAISIGKEDILPLPLTLITEILSRKCNYLEVYGRAASITLTEVENLVQFFHHLEKKVALNIPIDTAMRQMQIGEYSVDIADEIFGRAIVIEHTNMEPNMNDKFG